MKLRNRRDEKLFFFSWKQFFEKVISKSHPQYDRANIWFVRCDSTQKSRQEVEETACKARKFREFISANFLFMFIFRWNKYWENSKIAPSCLSLFCKQTLKSCNKILKSFKNHPFSRLFYTENHLHFSIRRSQGAKFLNHNNKRARLFSVLRRSFVQNDGALVVCWDTACGLATPLWLSFEWNTLLATAIFVRFFRESKFFLHIAKIECATNKISVLFLNNFVCWTLWRHFDFPQGKLSFRIYGNLFVKSSRLKGLKKGLFWRKFMFWPQCQAKKNLFSAKFTMVFEDFIEVLGFHNVISF